jgi:16S rRNA processing protein RimM
LIKDFLEIGKICSPHGVGGEMRVEPWCDSADFMKKFKTLYCDSKGEKALKVISLRPHGNVVLLKAEGINDMDAAAAMRDTVLYIRRSDAHIKDGSWFIAELNGCSVEDDTTGEVYGTVTDVMSTGANDVWQISKDGKDYLLPAIPDVVKSVDVKSGIIKITPLKGIFDDEN